ncbi:acylphosphatase-2-like [Huso huso]|uniref:acylphosphatase n=2 Tax=Acipenseridae TaxID=7900 RepID=A0AAD8CJP7_ACIOX|nr:acylphosphatase-2-like [Acipenser ruthenus]XP_058871950.1 acylphosphatase-2-like [Acipenser ruthenus]KAK1150928.1 acylphosphatase-2-like [Acipenser oxyrinchus oxyrinchus]KAK1154886.1 acylphosphatase-2-like [Acipenser oxyrinchus oxyrinchus]
MSSSSGLVSVDYEVFGEVQGVFFRKHTEDQGNKLKLVGWVKNTPRDTVVGQVQGPRETVQIMKNWLRTVGSPMSRIDKVTFTNETQISSLEFSSFTTRY